ncbi:MAG: enoyl-CoA hydratase/isomerase family protein [Actinomycetes bacterium]
MAGTVIRDEPAEGVVRLKISNPNKRGALDHPILDELANKLPSTDEARCLILTGEDKIFSAGYDIGDIPEAVFAEEAEKLIAHPFAAALEGLDRCEVPIVAAITGHAVGGGLEIALACDLRIAEPTARFGMPPAKLGLVYSHTGLRRFIDAVGVPRTRELFLLGRRIDAQTAHHWGLVNEISAEGGVAEQAVAMAVELVNNAPLSIRGNKRILRELASAAGELEPGVEQELLELRRACFSSADFREGVSAFTERREARFEGR